MGSPVRALYASDSFGGQPVIESRSWVKPVQAGSDASIATKARSTDEEKEKLEFFKRSSSPQEALSDTSRSTSLRPLSSFWRTHLLRIALIVLLVVVVSKVSRQKFQQLLQPEEGEALKEPPVKPKDDERATDDRRPRISRLSEEEYFSAAEVLSDGESEDAGYDGDLDDWVPTSPSPELSTSSSQPSSPEAGTPPPIPVPDLVEPEAPAPGPEPPPLEAEEEQPKEPSPPEKPPSVSPVPPAVPVSEVKPSVEVEKPPEVVPPPKPEEDFGPLIHTLTGTVFAPAKRYKDHEGGLQDVKNNWLKGDPNDVVMIRGNVVLRAQLQDMLPGRSIDVTTLHLYCDLLQKHFDVRAEQKIQEPVGIISPCLVGEMWKPFYEEGKPPVIPESVQAQCKNASKVLFIQPAPLLDPTQDSVASSTGHLILVVIDRKNNWVRIVDSLPQKASYYEQIATFVLIIAEQLGGLKDTEDRHYMVSPVIPEGEFPKQPEALPPELFTEDIYLNACGVYAMEALIAIGEGRKPSMIPEDIPWVRVRMLLELYGGLHDRPLADGGVRAALGQLFQD